MIIDWSKAPEGTTHYVLSREAAVPSGWYQADGNKMRNIFLDGEYTFRLDDVHPGRLLDLFERPTAWNGEGLPPVGTVCELRAHRLTDWSMAKIEFAYRNVIVWDWIGEPSMNGLCTAYAHNVEMRPIRTPEQIAAEERDKEIEALVAVLRTIKTSCYRAGAEVILSAGYRKQVIDD